MRWVSTLYCVRNGVLSASKHYKHHTLWLLPDWGDIFGFSTHPLFLCSSHGHVIFRGVALQISFSRSVAQIDRSPKWHWKGLFANPIHTRFGRGLVQPNKCNGKFWNTFFNWEKFSRGAFINLAIQGFLQWVTYVPFTLWTIISSHQQTQLHTSILGENSNS